MSWDILIINFPEDLQSLSEITHGLKPTPLGKRDDVIAQIHQVLPGADFSDRSWGILDHSGLSIEFNMGKEEVCDGVTLHVRGGGSAIATIVQLLEHLKLRAIDHQTGEFFSAEAAHASFGQWQAYRDRAMQNVKPLEDNR